MESQQFAFCPLNTHTHIHTAPDSRMKIKRRFLYAFTKQKIAAATATTIELKDKKGLNSGEERICMNPFVSVWHVRESKENTLGV